MWLESWRESFKNYSQWVNLFIASSGSIYLLLTPDLNADLPNWIVSVFALLAFLNIDIS